MKRNGVFISYSHKDKKWLTKLKSQLNHLERKYEFAIWDDSKIDAGSKWRAEIQTALDTTRVAILLISADFLASDFIQNEELPPLLKAAKKDGAVILMVIVSPCMINDLESLSKYQYVNLPNAPLNGMDEHQIDQIFVKVTENTKRILIEFQDYDNVKKKVSNESRKENEMKEFIGRSLATYTILNLLSNYELDEKLTMTDLHRMSKIKNRKFIAKAIYDMESMGIIQKNKTNNKTYFSLTETSNKILNRLILK